MRNLSTRPGAVRGPLALAGSAALALALIATPVGAARPTTGTHAGTTAYTASGADQGGPGVVILQGSVTGAGDVAVGDGAVSVQVFPALPAGRDFYPVGKPLEMLSLVTPVDAGGDYQVAADPAVLDGYVDEFGIMDLIVTTVHSPTSDATTSSKSVDGEVVSQSITASTRLAPQAGLDGAAGRGLAERADGTAIGVITFDPARDRVRVATGEHPFSVEAPTTAAPDQMPQHGAAGQRIGGEGAEAAATEGGACRVTPSTKHLGRPERFMYADNWKGAKFTFSQRRGVEHTLGVAVKPAGKDWSATLASTKTLATNDSATLEQQVQKWARNKVNYQDFEMRFCSGPGGTERVERRPTSQHSLLVKSAKGNRPIYSTADCQPVGTNYSMTKDEVSNQVVSAGVDLKTVSVSAQSGFSAGSSWSVKVTRRSKMCFSNSEGPLQSRYVKFLKRGNKASGSCRPARSSGETGQRGCTTT